mmetsp:Transcript_26735/g.60892  ORF Transcript_26735/g.60892 Transcript_26735/m.60892 type:complete len:400 (-) Transcript_26735:661-1860(-)
MHERMPLSLLVYGNEAFKGRGIVVPAHGKLQGPVLPHPHRSPHVEVPGEDVVRWRHGAAEHGARYARAVQVLPDPHPLPRVEGQDHRVRVLVRVRVGAPLVRVAVRVLRHAPPSDPLCAVVPLVAPLRLPDRGDPAQRESALPVRAIQAPAPPPERRAHSWGVDGHLQGDVRYAAEEPRSTNVLVPREERHVDTPRIGGRNVVEDAVVHVPHPLHHLAALGLCACEAWLVEVELGGEVLAVLDVDGGIEALQRDQVAGGVVHSVALPQARENPGQLLVEPKVLHDAALGHGRAEHVVHHGLLLALSIQDGIPLKGRHGGQPADSKLEVTIPPQFHGDPHVEVVLECVIWEGQGGTINAAGHRRAVQSLADPRPLPGGVEHIVHAARRPAPAGVVRGIPL